MVQNDIKETLSTTEQTSVMKAIFDIINSNQDIDGELNFEALNVDGSSYGVFSKSGAVYLSKDILGGFKGAVPFTLQYRSQPKKDSGRIKMIDNLNMLSEWMTKTDYPSMTQGRIIEKIEAVTVPYLYNVEESGSITYAVEFNLEYRKEA